MMKGVASANPHLPQLLRKNFKSKGGAFTSPLKPFFFASRYAVMIIAKATMKPGMKPAVNMAVTDKLPRIA